VREAVAGYRRPTLAGELGAARELLAAAAVALAQSGDLGELPPDAEAALAWAVREAVTNVIRHSRARRCSIALTRAGGRVAVEICDDGRAPAGGADGAGSGLRGLAERVEGLGGAVEAGPRARGGCRLAVSLPAEMDDGAGRLAEDERAEAS